MKKIYFLRIGLEILTGLMFLIFAGPVFATTVPGAPTNVSATAGNGQATISFSPPANANGVINYIVTASPGGARATGGQSPITVTGLTNGTAYTFTIRAANAAGTTGPESAASAAVTPAKASEQPIGVGVSLPGTITGGQSYTVPQYVWGIYSFSMKAAVALATLMMVYAGYKYLTSKGESGAINEAKDILFSTLMGAALLMLVILVANLAGLEISAPK